MNKFFLSEMKKIASNFSYWLLVLGFWLLVIGLITNNSQLITIYAAPGDPTPSSLTSPPADCISTDLGCIPNQDPLRFASKIYEIGLGFIGTVALVFIIYGGYLVLTSKGDQLQLSKGKSYIVSAIIGVVMAISGYALYQIIAVDVIKLPGFSGR